MINFSYRNKYNKYNLRQNEGMNKINKQIERNDLNVL